MAEEKRYTRESTGNSEKRLLNRKAMPRSFVLFTVCRHLVILLNLPNNKPEACSGALNVKNKGIEARNGEAAGLDTCFSPPMASREGHGVSMRIPCHCASCFLF